MSKLYFSKLIIIILITQFHKSISDPPSKCILGEVTDDKMNCLKKTINGTYCCHLKPLNNQSLDSICYPYNFTEYLGNLHINYDKNIYEIDCGLGSTFMDSNWKLTIEDRYFCGKENPTTKKDCSDSSTKTNSCCYYYGHGLNVCYWLGVKYEAKSKHDGYTFECNAFYGKVYLFWIFVLYSFIIV